MENTFTSIDDMMDKVFSFLSPIKSIVLRNHWRSIDIISKIKVPILFIVATEDELVPPSMTKMLYAKATLAEKKQLYEIKGAGHNGSYMAEPEQYCRKMSAFVREL